MMLKLSRQTVRHSWQPYVGALVALAFGIALLSVAVTVGAAVDTTGHRAGLSAEERAQLSDLAALFGIMSGVSLFMAIFVVGSTFGFVVATRRRQLGLLRLVGATPRQVRRMVLGESAVVAVVAAVVGSLVGMLAAPAFLEVVR
jgi:putative ABC transport system permease protein